MADSRFVERYLLGQLSDAESRSLEKMLKEQPALLDELDLPSASDRLARLLALNGNGTHTSATVPRWRRPGIVLALVIALVAAVSLGIGSAASKRALLNDLNATRASIAAGSLTAPEHVAHVRVIPSSPTNTPATIDLGDRIAPALAELRIDVSRLPPMDYSLTIRREDQTYWARIDHLRRDSNNELSIAINVSTLPAGRYNWQLDTIDIHGDRKTVGQFLTSVSAQ